MKPIFSVRTHVAVATSLLLGACASTPLAWSKTDGGVTANAETDLQRSAAGSPGTNPGA